MKNVYVSKEFRLYYEIMVLRSTNGILEKRKYMIINLMNRRDDPNSKGFIFEH